MVWCCLDRNMATGQISEPSIMYIQILFSEQNREGLQLPVKIFFFCLSFKTSLLFNELYYYLLSLYQWENNVLQELTARRDSKPSRQALSAINCYGQSISSECLVGILIVSNLNFLFLNVCSSHSGLENKQNSQEPCAVEGKAVSGQLFSRWALISCLPMSSHMGTVKPGSFQELRFIKLKLSKTNIE